MALADHYRLFINRVQTQIATIGGGGAGFIKDLDDVDISGLADNYILQYDATNSKWLTVANNAGAGGTWASNNIGISTTNLLVLQRPPLNLMYHFLSLVILKQQEM